ncbi:MAG: hypothetical protein H0T18_05520 [Chloroflexia bacterium]|nr:hypothetical protein [Chloroflexia bacterium]
MARQPLIGKPALADFFNGFAARVAFVVSMLIAAQRATGRNKRVPRGDRDPSATTGKSHDVPRDRLHVPNVKILAFTLPRCIDLLAFLESNGNEAQV